MSHRVNLQNEPATFLEIWGRTLQEDGFDTKLLVAEHHVAR